MTHQMAQGGTLWPSTTIRLGPHSCLAQSKNGLVLLIASSGLEIGTWWLQNTLLL